MSRSSLITGVTGYIGGKLADRLIEDGWAVHALLRNSSTAPSCPNLQIHRYDGSVEDLTRIVGEAAPDVVFHLASLYLADHRPEQVDDLIGSNILLPAQLVEAMSAAGATRLVNTGTAWQHFNTDGYNPVNLYAATKQACEDLLRYYHDARGLSVLTLKLFDTFGPGDKRRKLIRILFEAAQSDEVLEMSPGEQLIDLLYIDDVVDGFLVAADGLLASDDPVIADYLLPGTRQSLRALVSVVEQALGVEIRVQYGRRPYRTREVMRPLEATSERRLPGWSPRYTLTEALQRLREGDG
jgi:nucleoside-diphosphate-sugar epimerase